MLMRYRGLMLLTTIECLFGADSRTLPGDPNRSLAAERDDGSLLARMAWKPTVDAATAHSAAEFEWTGPSVMRDR